MGSCQSHLGAAADIPDLSAIVGDLFGDVDLEAAEDCGNSPELQAKSEACLASYNGGITEFCSKECADFYNFLGEGDCGDFYKSVGMNFVFDVCDDGKLTSDDFNDVGDITGHATIQHGNPAALLIGGLVMILMASIF